MPRTLRLPGSDQIWTAERADALVLLRAGTEGCERTRERAFPDPESAGEFLRKEEWSRLKKGYRLIDPDAAPGKPRLHRFLAKGYTGALVATEVDGRFLTNRPDASEAVVGIGTETLVFVESDGTLTEACALAPETLAWRAIAAPATGQILVLVDHRVFACDRVGGALTPLTGGHRDPASFLSVAGPLAAWYDAPYLVVRDLITGEDRLRLAATPSLHGGHTFQMEGALSPDGTSLVVCTTPGELRLIDVASGTERVVAGEFAMIERFLFTPDGTLLLAQERYGGWRLLGFDPRTGASQPRWPDLGDLSRAEIAIAPQGDRLAVTHRERVRIYGLPDGAPQFDFPIDHGVRRSAIVWLDGETVGLRTDLGCASLYAVPRQPTRS